MKTIKDLDYICEEATKQLDGVDQVRWANYDWSLQRFITFEYCAGHHREKYNVAYCMYCKTPIVIFNPNEHINKNYNETHTYVHDEAEIKKHESAWKEKEYEYKKDRSDNIVLIIIFVFLMILMLVVLFVGFH